MRSTEGANGEKLDSDTAPPCTVPACTFCANAAPTPNWPAGCNFTKIWFFDPPSTLDLNAACITGYLT